MKRTCVVLGLAFLICQLYAQLPEVKKRWSPVFNLGVGYGIDYGGIGGRLCILPLERLQVFGALGYFLDDVCFNTGASTRLVTKTRFIPYFGAMYGNNAYIISKDRQVSTAPNKASKPENHYYRYYGASLNAGLECWITPSTFLNFELLIPFAGSTFKEDVQTLTNKFSSYVIEESDKIGISAGIHFRILQP